MTRRSLRPSLNQIRGWVRQGRTDAWIAHQLEVPVQQIQAFKRENGLIQDGDEGEPGVDPTEEFDLRAEDDAQIAAELDAEEERRREEEERKAEEKKRKAEEAAKRRAEAAAKRKAEAEAKAAEAAAATEDEAEADAAAGGGDEADEDAEEEKPKRRTRRGGRRKRVSTTLEGTFDHGEEGYGLWLDPAVQDDPVYAEHWAGHRPIEVTIEEDQIVIRRATGEDEDDD